MRKIRTVLFAVGLVLAACNKEQQPTTISLNFNSVPFEALSGFSVQEDLYFELTPQDTIQNINVSKNTFLVFKKDFGHHYVYAKPEEQLVLDTLSSKPLILGAVAKISPENGFLNDYMTTLHGRSKDDLLNSFRKAADSFQILLKTYNAPLVKALETLEASSIYDEHFKTVMKDRIALDMAAPYIDYESYHNYFNKKSPEIPEGFYAALDALNLKNEDYLNFPDNLEDIKGWLTKDVAYTEDSSVDEYYEALREKLKDKLGKSTMADYFEHAQLIEGVNFGKGFDESLEDIKAFREGSAKKVLVSLLNSSIAPWEKLKAGNPAPNFSGKTTKQESISINDLKGKRVYVDVWATWCGPCIAEIPALKKLEEELKDENIQFLSISIDEQKDAEKWAKFVADKELGGLQLLTEGAWKSDLAQAYNIKGIPRFFIIDEAGNFISSNAPRPSDPKVKDWLLN